MQCLVLVFCYLHLATPFEGFKHVQNTRLQKTPTVSDYMPFYGQMLLSPADTPGPRWLRTVLLKRWSHVAEEVSSRWSPVLLSDQRTCEDIVLDRGREGGMERGRSP